MSWLWGNETTEQAQFVVSALQGELDERETKIKALEAALRREQQDMTTLLQDEVKELETRRQAIAKELAGVDALIKEKQRLIQRSKNEASKKKKKGKKSKEAQAEAAEDKPEVETEPKTAPAADTSAAVVVASPKAKKKQQQKKKKKAESAANGAAKTDETKVLPMDKILKKVAKEEPNVAFIIQRSNNSNTVVYAGRKSDDGSTLDPTNPMQVYWIMYEKEGNPREDLNMIERNTAYGVTSRPTDVAGEYLAAIASLRDRDCILQLDAHGNVMALTTINGKKGMLLRRVFVQMTTSWGIPTVDYVDIFGVDPVTHEAVYEKKKNK
ncbi:hypothetical protein BBO99_00003593 [Phytophthora kernoviae]|uniref:DUF4833 domain-containing protein n=2 Tax=Phytophthora kernoviae TaxID=325452 RepID=A0A3R7HK13_9STRA|nr:hypothetical protein G195_005943 [Phytophthora kernoviae 00238/432]KAG2523658.1 hypothetical protein JM16_003293 [Phytophthora kernoviae]KAG2529092.1 hypothetical protein JM18_002938 [Phytophthora kernoviae]RLN27327.1 hypothetical protein BBI17_003734 [Phytophthora kernoviae]RLN81575.1 hypothetical protein BBO99_00003593 [Phytophthora kernoviae]